MHRTEGEGRTTGTGFWSESDEMLKTDYPSIV